MGWSSKKALLVTLPFVLLAGCTFHSNQISTLRSMFNQPEQANVQWRARYGNKVVPVVAINHEPFVVFANNDGVAIAFDGWHVRSVVGFGLSNPLAITFQDNDPRFSGGTTGLGQGPVHRCEPWFFTESAGGGQWLQRCSAEFYYQNAVALDGDGRIIRIEQIVDASGTRLILEKSLGTP